MKSKNIKIKHRKYSLYTRKKSKGRQALAVILTIVIAAALCVVGFGLGRPLMDYFNGNKTPSDSSSGWTPPVEDTAETVVADTETAAATAESAESSEVQETTAEVVYTIPAGALRSAEMLKNAAAKAKAEGYTTVMVTMKNSVGNYLYVTDRPLFQYGDIISGTLSAKEICDIITAEGLVPCARISTLKDKLSSNYIEGIKYYNSDGSGWLDAAYANGGKAWLDPFSEKTSEYLASIVTELTTAGFKNIILADTMYPVFRYVDLNTYLGNQPHLDDSAARLDALWNVVNACDAAAKSSGAKIMLELTSEDLDATERTATTGEIAADKVRLKSVELLIDYTPVSGSEYAGAKSFAGKLNTAYSGQSYSVLVSQNALSESAYQQLLKAFGESGVRVFSE